MLVRSRFPCLWVGVLFTLLVGTVEVQAAQGSEDVGRLSAEQGHSAGDDELFRQAVLLEIPEATLLQLKQSCLSAGFTTVEFTRLIGLMTRAKLAGLPHRQLLKKLEEGLAKGALPERIQDALQEKARTLRAAKEVADQLIMQGWVAQDYTLAVAMVADALEAGAEPAKVLRAVRQDRLVGEGIPDVRAVFQRPLGK